MIFGGFQDILSDVRQSRQPSTLVRFESLDDGASTTSGVDRLTRDSSKRLRASAVQDGVYQQY